MKKLNIKSIKIFLGVFFLAYFVMVFGLWTYMNIQRSLGARQDLRNYITKHSPQLKNKLFSQVFSKAKLCLEMVDQSKKTACEKKVGKEFASNLKEEELTRVLGWPNDLYLVKKIDNRFYSLGWSGKLQDTTHKTNISRLESVVPQIVRFLTRNCKYFNVYDNSSWSCEIYEPIYLSKRDKGYLVRINTITEEMSFPIALVLPMLSITNVSNLQYIHKTERYFFFTLLSAFIIPLIVAFIALQKYKRKLNKKKGRTS